jgi:SAM-dependent MidA family methyltransferase
MTDRNHLHPSSLEAVIRRRIEEQGGITFAEYMALCLYHPEFGYYMVTRQRIGKGGDFFTSSSVHALFGRLVARQLKQMWEVMGRGAFTIAEQGAGEGHLCLDILDAAAEEFPEFYSQLIYRMIEVSPDNRARQESLLAGHQDRVVWCELEDVAGMEGCFLSNELVDAFPVHLIERHGEEFQEVFVTGGQGTLAEELRPPSAPEIAHHFRWLGVVPGEGNRAEVNLEAVRWIRRIAGLLRRGFVLTIDYGYPAEVLYAPSRRSGTLLCYHQHAVAENPYERIGAQDITAHVDFTALQRAGEEEGLVPLYFGEQYRFLMALGFVEALMELQAREADEKSARNLRLILKNLILPEGGMGETFKILVQGKAVGEPSLLCARSLRDLPLPAGLV